jgi:hypothetical protein
MNSNLFAPALVAPQLFDSMKHPIAALRRLQINHGALSGKCKLTYSFRTYRYIHAYDNYEHVGEEEVLEIAPKTGQSLESDVIVQELISKLPKGAEIAIGSKVVDEELDTYHFPMLDFAEPVSNDGGKRIVTSLAGTGIAEEAGREMWLYSTGRSYHGYFPKLMEGQDSLYRFLGQALLANPADEEPVVDARWIGWVMQRGYAACRWSCNSDDKKQLPKLVGVYDVRSGIELTPYFGFKD